MPLTHTTMSYNFKVINSIGNNQCYVTKLLTLKKHWLVKKNRDFKNV